MSGELHDTMMESRDLEAQFDSLVLDGPGQDIDDIRDRRMIRELRDECDGEWRYGIGFIREDCFEDYARELADDIGAIDSKAGWPTNRIDWAAAAEDLKMDYTTTEVGGFTYYYR